MVSDEQTRGQRTVFRLRADTSAAELPSTAYVYSTTESPDSWWVLIKLASACSHFSRRAEVDRTRRTSPTHIFHGISDIGLSTLDRRCIHFDLRTFTCIAGGWIVEMGEERGRSALRE